MKTETQEINDLLRELVETFIDHPGDFLLTAECFPGAVYWEMSVHADDYGKAVGKGGAHVKALAFLIKSIGAARDELHKFKLHDPELARRTEDRKQQWAESFDARPARDLLCRILAEVGLGDYAVDIAGVAGPVRPIEFTFGIAVRSDEDYRELTVAGTEGLTIVGAVGTLFRAYAARAGVRFQINVLRP